MKCMATGCDKHATKDMDFCLTHSDMQEDYDKARIRQGKAIQKMKRNLSDYKPALILKNPGIDAEEMERQLKSPGHIVISEGTDVEFLQEPAETDFNVLAKQFTDRLCKTLIQKNEAYGASYDKSVEKRGNVVTFIRLEDKINRLEQLILKESKPNDESVEDTLLDLAGYSVLEMIRRHNNPTI